MGTKRRLERRLARADRFENPRVDLEQYATPADIAAQIVHYIDLQGDIADRTVIDLGTGPGILSLGCAHRRPERVIGIDIDAAALAIARKNERRVEPPLSIAWVQADATRPPLRRTSPSTVIMNPPFGAQKGHRHADRAFLEAASRLADVSYSIHNAGSQAFVESFASDNGGVVTDGIAINFDLAHQFDFHEEARSTVEAELFRISWQDSHSSP